MKKVHGNLYVHRSNVGELPNYAKELMMHAEAILPSSYEWNMLKVAKTERVSFMLYPNFYDDPHPSLHQYANVDVKNGKIKYGSKSKNPPILHRKETFISKDDPEYSKFAKLTEQEIKAGLYTKDLLSHIGTKKFWEDLLITRNLKIKDHILHSNNNSAKTAITRNSPSALAKVVGEFLKSNDSVFDWGCGKGSDLTYYISKVNLVGGWDPYHKPVPSPLKLAGNFNVVTCSCVLNVLEKDDRHECLKDINRFLPLDGVLYLSVRSNINPKSTWVRKGDGWITSIGTFQHEFNQNELIKLVSMYFNEPEIINKSPLIVKAVKEESK
ncbi:MAG: hypothetical protein SVO01_06550 [Thermotogota bacterium]|nr:hypothetical protein [Thermotogota bacterium]